MPMVYLKLFYDQIDALDAYSDEEVGRLIRGAVCYARDRIQPSFDGNERFIWPTFKASIDRSNAEYDDLCKTRQECAKKGGRPPKKPKGFSENQKVFEEPKGFLENQKNLREEDEEEKEEELPPPTPSKGETPDGGACGGAAYVNTYIKFVNQKELLNWFDRLPEKVVTHAADEATAYGQPAWKYMKAILERYERQHIQTVEEAKRSDGNPRENIRWLNENEEE